MTPAQKSLEAIKEALEKLTDPKHPDYVGILPAAKIGKALSHLPAVSQLIHQQQEEIAALKHDLERQMAIVQELLNGDIAETICN